WKEKYAAFQRTEGYKYVDPTGLDKYREREILAAVSLENTSKKLPKKYPLPVARCYLWSLNLICLEMKKLKCDMSYWQKWRW
ncbi:hypothetical protein OLZ13_26025, partial [Escherichia coli]|nr:hypothetical protein [Escherichia coli]